MNTIKLIDTLVHTLSEVLYMLACAIYYVWQYRCLIITILLLGTMLLGGLIIYGIQTNY